METTIRWARDERVAYLWTCYEPDARRWQRAGIAVRYERGAWWAEVPASWVRVRPPRRKTGGKAFAPAIIAAPEGT
ncbi:MAG: hypothetical protein AB1689_28620 [Thermodesulfobacteriota bacterium]